MKIIKVKTIKIFAQNPWLNLYISVNTEKKPAVKKSSQAIHQLVSKVFYENSIEKIRSRKIVTVIKTSGIEENQNNKTRIHSQTSNCMMILIVFLVKNRH